jgi:hypothetical protein
LIPNIISILTSLPEFFYHTSLAGDSMSSFEIRFGQHAISGYPPPAQCGDLQMQVQYTGELIELTAVSFSIRLDQAIAQIWPERFQLIRPITYRSSQGVQYLALRVPLDAITVSFIEQIRQGSGPLQFIVLVSFFYHRLVPAPQPTDGSQASPLYMLGLSEMGQSQATCTVQRDEWLEVLKIIGWQEYAVFEIPTTPLHCDERFNKALDLLDKAKEAFRMGEFDACIVHARRALEAAAATTSESDTKLAFRQLWQDVLPNDVDTPKRDTLDCFATGVGKLRHEAAHGKGLHFQLRRSDAQLVLTIAISLLRYIGEEFERTSAVG